MRQHLLIDADDTLWENNIYFERAFDSFCEYLNHSCYSPMRIREILDEIELVNILKNGYGAVNFGRNMVQCFQKIAEREHTSVDETNILQLAHGILDHPLELIEEVEVTLQYLSERHDMVLMTKGDVAEQTRKVEQSGLQSYFREVVVVREKDAPTYRRVVQQHKLDEGKTWMIGNSPKSDINPALEAGLRAVYVPHERTWHLEHQEVRQAAGLLVVERFGHLRNHF